MLTDGCTDGQMDGKPDPYIAPCLRQARQKQSFTKKLYATDTGKSNTNVSFLLVAGKTKT